MPSKALAAALAALFAPMAIASPYASPKPLPVAAVFQPGVISTADDESHPTFSPDGVTLYFLKNSPTFNHWTIVTSRFARGRWGTPVVEPYSGQYNDADVFFAKDGSMYFISNRPVDGKPRTDNEIWVRRRTASGWAEPEHIAELSSPRNEWFPTVTDDGTLYFGSGRDEDNVHPGSTDLYRSRLVDGHYAKPENLGPTINTAGSDTEAWIAPDESYIVFSSNGYKDTRGADDIYIAFRDGDGWSTPRNLGDAVNSTGSEYGAKPSPDGKYLFFCSNRGFSDKPLDHRLDYAELTTKLHAPGNGLNDIYQVDIGVLGLKR
jgi:Tol biopolymer transport system component